MLCGMRPNQSRSSLAMIAARIVSSERMGCAWCVFSLPRRSTVDTSTLAEGEVQFQLHMKFERTHLMRRECQRTLTTVPWNDAEIVALAAWNANGTGGTGTGSGTGAMRWHEALFPRAR